MTDNLRLDPEDNRYIVPALERGLLLLSQFNRQRHTYGAPELAQRLQLPRSTVFRLLCTLESMGFVERTDSGREYQLGVRVLRLGFEYLASLDLSALGTPLVSRLCQQVGHTANLVVRDGRDIVSISKAASATTPFIGAISVGSRLPAHATVLGLILLSGLPLDALKHLYPEPELKAFSDQTPQDVNELYQACVYMREQGYGVGEGFFDTSISTIAAPVCNRHGEIVAALGVTLAALHMDAAQRLMLIDSVREVAGELSALLDYAPATQGRHTAPLRGLKGSGA